MRFCPELAITYIQLAELLLEYYHKGRAKALGHIDFAISEFRDMKMRPWLERSLRHKDILKALAFVSGSSGNKKPVCVIK